MNERHVLVVDDDPAMAEIVREQVVASGWEATCVHDVRSALSRLACGRYRLVVSDLHMPAADGFELLAAVRSRWPETGVVLMSAFPAAETRDQALEAGALALLAKPFSLEELGEALTLGSSRA